MLPEMYMSPNVTPLIVVISPLVSLIHDQKAEMTKYSLEVVMHRLKENYVSQSIFLDTKKTPNKRNQ